MAKAFGIDLGMTNSVAAVSRFQCQQGFTG
jgi:molecular chaperone DnaK (HSP70)